MNYLKKAVLTQAVLAAGLAAGFITTDVAAETQKRVLPCLSKPSGCPAIEGYGWWCWASHPVMGCCMKWVCAQPQVQKRKLVCLPKPSGCPTSEGYSWHCVANHPVLKCCARWQCSQG